MNVLRGFRQFARVSMAMLLPRRAFMVHGPRASRSICITFDDGPHPEHTESILTVLKRENVTATFFVVGKCAAEHPALVQRIVDDGHCLGHHTYSHSDPSETSSAQLMIEIERTNEILFKQVGFSPTLFRPPHGKLTPRKLLRLWGAGMTVVLWNADPKDFSCHTAGELRTRLQAYEPVGGDVLLFHDNVPWARELLPEFIDRVREHGLQFCTPLDWMSNRHSGGARSLTRVDGQGRDGMICQHRDSAVSKETPR